MIVFVLGLYGALVAAVLVVGRTRPSVGHTLAAVGPGATAVVATWALVTDTVDRASVVWVAGLNLELGFVLDPLRALLALVVGGIGVLVMVYLRGYLAMGRASAADHARLTATLLAFAGAMTALVLADTVWALFLSWEATSILSFLLVGHNRNSDVAVGAARRALVVTGAGGLVLLAGGVLLVDATGTASFSAMEPTTGWSATAAAVLLVVAAATKSAQVPFHNWLPGAMAAPTPVSAYLHSATMVKAGLILVAVAAPVLADNDWFGWSGLAFGTASMFWGAVGALRHQDAKLVLAWGTISQLGLILVLLSVGTAKATFAALAMLVAHAIFKAALFMGVGELDLRTGTRALDRLRGSLRRVPMLAGVFVVSGVSMAGLGPVLGFATKEAAIEAVLAAPGVRGDLVTVAVVGGAVLTSAYTVRLLVLLLGASPQTAAIEIRRAGASLRAPAAVASAASMLAFVGLPWIATVVTDAATVLDRDAAVYTLYRFAGFNAALWTSLVAVGAGAILGVVCARQTIAVPGRGGDHVVDALIDGVPTLGRAVAGRLQHGSLPLYVVTMSGVVLLASVPFFAGIGGADLRWWDHPAQPVLGAAAVAAAAAAAAASTRLDAALRLGAVGISVSGLFLVQGAPDLVLTQLLVESVLVVGFVLGLGHLRLRFPVSSRGWMATRLMAACAVGVAVSTALVVAGSSSNRTAPVDAMVRGAVDAGGGRNVVNVILTDLRALDTVGEVIVLIVVAVGLLALRSTTESIDEPSDPAPAGRTVTAGAVRVAEPLALVVASYLFFAGHNQPGGGFSAGLVVGAVLSLRALTGRPLGLSGERLAAVGGVVIGLVALGPMLFGRSLLDQVVVSVAVPVLGTIKTGSAIVFDGGVVLVVAGLVSAVLVGLRSDDIADRGSVDSPSGGTPSEIATPDISTARAHAVRRGVVAP